jgi:Holliday junction resolvasome RuvABC DNA-binding subunit
MPRTRHRCSSNFHKPVCRCTDGFLLEQRSAREKDLRRALDTAIGSLHALGTLYERREMRWAEEKLKLDEDKERVQLLLKQVLGAGVFGTVGGPTTPA